MLCECKAKDAHKDGRPTTFEADLLDCNIKLINTCTYHPQTNGKMMVCYQNSRGGDAVLDSISEFVAYCNKE